MVRGCAGTEQVCGDIEQDCGDIEQGCGGTGGLETQGI